MSAEYARDYVFMVVHRLPNQINALDPSLRESPTQFTCLPLSGTRQGEPDAAADEEAAAQARHQPDSLLGEERAGTAG